MQSTTLTFPVPDQDGAAALRRAVAVLSTGGYTVQSSSDTEAIGVKRVIPGWAIVMAVIFGLFCLVGLLFLLVKEEREVRATLVGGATGASIVVTGAMNGKVIDRLRAELGSGAPTSAASRAVPPVVEPSGTPIAAVPSAPPVPSPPPAPVDGPVDLLTVAPPPGAPPSSWVPPATLSGSALDEVELGPAASAASAAGATAAADVEGYTVARPPRLAPRTAPSVRLDDGTVLVVTTLTLLGRDPAGTDGEESAQLVALTDETRGLSKTHAGLAVVDGRLVVTDRHSTNGTVLRRPSGEERSCIAGQPTPVEVGDTVVVGGRSLVRVT